MFEPSKFEDPASELPPPLDVLQEAVAGRYSLEARVGGRGGPLLRIRARDVALDRPVLLNVLAPDRAADPETRRRFLKAARSAAGLFHPHILPVHSVEETPTFVFAVAGLVDGETVTQRVERDGPMEPAQVRRFVEEAAWGLAHAHARGVFHGDLGPHSLILESDSDRARVADFTLIQAVLGPGSRTSEGVWHLAPELRGGDPPDARADLFGLGATARFALTGRPPGASTADEVEDAPPRLQEVVKACLSEAPPRRPASALAVAQDAAEEGAVPATLPPAVHRLLRRIRRFSPVAGIGLVILWILREGSMELVAASVVGLVFGVMGVGLFRSAREVLRQGLDADVITWILEEEARAMAAQGDAPSRGLQNFAIGCGGFMFVLGAVPVALLALASLWSVLTGGGIVGLAAWQDMSVAAVLLFTFLFLAGPSLPDDSPLRSLDWGERMMVGRFGRLLFRLARVRLGPSTPGFSRGEGIAGLAAFSRGTDAGQPTEALLFSEAEALFRSLPSELRHRFDEVPRALEDLRNHLAALSRRDEELAELLRARGVPDEDTPTRQAVEKARRRARARVGEGVAAMEYLRLQMLQMASGVGDEGELTVELERARELGDELKALIGGAREVREALEEKPSGARPSAGHSPSHGDPLSGTEPEP